MKEKFESLTAQEQYAWILTQDKSKIQISLDNDVTYIAFDGEEETEFKTYIGDARGVMYLLQSLGFNANFV